MALLLMSSLSFWLVFLARQGPGFPLFDLVVCMIHFATLL